MDNDYGINGWNKPNDLIRIRKMKTKKRQLQDRLFDESPSKKTKRGGQSQSKAKRLFQAQPPPPDEATNEDSTLMDLISMKQPAFNTSIGETTPSSTSLSPSPSSSSSMSPHRLTSINHQSGASKLSSSSGGSGSPSLYQLYSKNYVMPSPMKNYLPSLSSFSLLSTPPSVEKKRQRITPAPAVTSPHWGASGTGTSSHRTKASVRRGLDLSQVGEEEEPKETWHNDLCIDWSVKSRLLIKSNTPFGWNNALKTSEESSGISAFVRCIDMEPNPQTKSFTSAGSQLDTSLGAQFHQCCLYWQHPYLPTVKLFPRDNVHGISSLSGSASSNNTTYAGNIKLEDKALDQMFLEWVDSFRSAFQLLRTRQCPYFYIFANQFTCLFSAAGTQGLECLQVYVTPSTRGFREALQKEGIDFTLPFCEQLSQQQEKDKKSQSEVPEAKTKDQAEMDSDEEEPDKWLDEMGISQDLSVSMNVKTSPSNLADERGKSSLLMITGESSLAFFNFLINAKGLLITNSGAQAGLPPTIVSPIAFQGASLRSLTVKQNRLKKTVPPTSNRDKPVVEMSFSLELVGPILPHTVHMLCALLNKTVKNYDIQIDTMAATVPININRQAKFPEPTTSNKGKPNAFDVQNLSDCGTKRSLLEVLCRSDIIDTIHKRLECVEMKYKWS